MGYEGFTLSGVTVVLDESSAEAVASVAQDELGRLKVHIRRPSSRPRQPLAFWRSKRITIMSAAGQRPTILIDDARCSEDADEEDCWVPQVLVANRELLQQEVTLTYYLTGLLFPDGLITFDAAGIHWRLALLDDYVRTATKLDEQGKGLVTTVLTSEPLPPDRCRDADEAASLISLLLSFACGSPVSIARVDFSDDDGVAQTRLHHAPEEHRICWWGPIACNLSGSGTLGPFVTHSFGPALSTSKTYPLARLIHTLIDVRGESVVHTQGLLLANFLEVVRYHHALHVLVSAGEASRDGDWFLASNGKRLTFRQILHHFFRQIGLQGWRVGYAEFRNRVVHGDEIEGTTVGEQHAHVLDLLHFCDRVVLALLQWDAAGGKYLPGTAPERHSANSYGLNLTPFVR